MWTPPACWDDRIADPVAHWAGVTPGAVAIREPEASRDWDYASLDALIDQWRRWLLTHALEAGDRVGVLARNRMDHLALFFACMRLGATLVPLNWRLAAVELDNVLAVAGLRLLLLGDAVPPVSATGGVTVVPLASVCLPAPSVGWVTVASLSPTAVSMLLFTSGSTGEPKGVRVTNRQLFANALATIEGWRLTAEDVAPITTPLFHTSGWHIFTTPLLWCGGTIVLMEAFHAESFWATLAEERCTVAFLVPTQLVDWTAATHFGWPLPALRWLLVGGAPFPRRAGERALAAGYAVRDGYGLTEFGPNCFGHFDAGQPAAPVDLGHPLPFIETRLVADDGADVATGDVGELWLRGPQAFAGYVTAGGPEENLDGWIRTGDLLRRSAAGTFEVRGRRSDRIITGGENVYPAEVEAVLADHPDLAEVGVVGVPDPRLGEALCAVVSLRAGAVLALDALRLFAGTRLARYKLPRHGLVVARLPRLGSGKVDRAALRALASDGKGVTTG